MPKKKVTIENLAVMVKKGFDGVDKKFDETQKDINSVRSEIKNVRGELKDDIKTLRQEMKDGFRHTNARLDVIHGDIKDFVNRDEFEDVLSRLKLVEKTLGIKA